MIPASFPISRDADTEFDAEFRVPHVVVVDPQFDDYGHLATAARRGEIDLHFRSSGAEAIKLARKGRVDVWLVAAELDDMSGPDFAGLLQSRYGTAPLAIVEPDAARPAAGSTAGLAAVEARVSAVLSPPITVADVERLLGRSSAQPCVLPFVSSSAAKPSFPMRMPMGMSAAVAAVMVLVLG